MLSGHHVHCLVGLFTPVFSCLVLHVAEKVAFSMFSVECRAVLLQVTVRNDHQINEMSKHKQSFYFLLSVGTVPGPPVDA